MRRLLFVILATAPLAGCQFLSAGEDVNIPDPFEATQSGGKVVAEAIKGDEPEKAAFKDPTVTAVQAVAADLIPSTDPNARAQKISRARTDPSET